MLDFKSVSTPTENDRVAETETAAKPAVSERVLIVEDDPATRVGLAELVGAWGFQTDVAANGEEAMEKITSFRPAIIVSDLVMPRMGGLELLRALQGPAVRSHAHPVDRAGDGGLRGRGDQGRRVRLPEQARRSVSGCASFLQKAVERQETLREVKHLRRQLREQGSFGRIVGNSPSIRAIYRVIEQAAPTSASVLKQYVV